MVASIRHAVVIAATLCSLAASAGADGNSTNASSLQLSVPPPTSNATGGAEKFVIPPEFDVCPAWIKEYVLWHREQHSNASALRITWTADPVTGMGYGDRFRGMLYSFRVAASLKRVAQVVQRRPVRLERVFQPNLVDFRPPPGTAKEGGYPDNIFRHEDHFSEPDIYWGSNMGCDGEMPRWVPWGQQINVTSNTHEADVMCSCIFRAMFKPSDELAKLMKEERERSLPATATEYTAVHLRGVGMRGEMGGNHTQPANLTDYAPFVDAVRCAQQAAPGLPVFMAASDVDIREAIQQRQYPGVFGPTRLWAIHPNSETLPDEAKRPKEDEHLNTFVELGLLAGGKCAVWSPSGFSNLGRWWGGHAGSGCQVMEGHGGSCPKLEGW